jgi:uncharacterized protein YkwD
MRFRMFIIAAAISTPVIALGADSRTTNSNRTVAASQVSTSEQRLVDAVNGYRARYKLPPLEVDHTLMDVARHRVPFVDSRKSAGTSGYNHNACGQWSRDHAHRAGFSGPATDNLAMGHESPEDAVRGWGDEDGDRDPAGHNFQMRGKAKINGRWVDERYDRIGVAIRGRNYIAIFGRAN